MSHCGSVSLPSPPRRAEIDGLRPPYRSTIIATIMAMVLFLLGLSWPIPAMSRPSEQERAAVKAAKAAQKDGDHEAALEHWLAAFEASDDPGHLVAAAEVEITMNRAIDAYRHLERALLHRAAKRRFKRHVRRMLDKLEPHYLGALAQKKKADEARRAAEQEAERRRAEAKRKAQAEEQRRVLAAARDDLARQKQLEAKRKERELREERAARMQAERDWKGTAGWSTLAAGTVAAGAMTWWFLDYLSGQESLNKDVGAENSAGRFEGLDYRTYKSRQDELNRQATLSVAGIAVGGAAVAAGAWFLLSRPTPVDIVLSPGDGGWRFSARGSF